MPSDSATREQILDAAEALFSAQGFGATTIKAIGARARANPALIYYYFGSKDTLYQEVLKRLFASLLAAAGRELDAQPGPAEAIRQLIGLQAQRLAERPALPRMLAREMIDPHARHAAEQVGELASGVFRRLCALIEQGQAAGVFRGDLDARFCALSAVSLVPYSHIARPAVGVLLGGLGAASDAQLAAYAGHAAEFVLSALRVLPPSTPGAAA